MDHKIAGNWLVHPTAIIGLLFPPYQSYSPVSNPQLMIILPTYGGSIVSINKEVIVPDGQRIHLFLVILTVQILNIAYLVQSVS